MLCFRCFLLPFTLNQHLFNYSVFRMHDSDDSLQIWKEGVSGLRLYKISLLATTGRSFRIAIEIDWLISGYASRSWLRSMVVFMLHRDEYEAQGFQPATIKSNETVVLFFQYEPVLTWQMWILMYADDDISNVRKSGDWSVLCQSLSYDMGGHVYSQWIVLLSSKVMIFNFFEE